MPDTYFDPFKLLYVDCYEPIFKFLEVKDILTLSETCSSFYTMIAKNHRVMNRIKLVVAETHFRRFKDTLAFTNRAYQHLEILGLYGIESTLEMSMLLEFCGDSMKTIKTCYEIVVNNPLKSIVEIVYFGGSKITLDRLGLIAAAVNLKRLILWTKVENPGYLADFVREKKSIEKLVLEQQSSFACIEELDKFKTYDCDLKALHVDLSCEHRWGNHHENLLKFVSKQRQIRDIKFCSNIKQFAEILKALPHLERITFALTMANSYYYFAQIPTQRNLKEANLIQVSEDFLKQFIENNPQIETLYVSELTKEMLKAILAFSRGLKLLKFASVSGDCTLEELKRFYEVMYNVMQVKNNSSLKMIQI